MKKGIPSLNTNSPSLFLNDVAFFRDVQTVQELSDILISYSANLLDVGGGLGDVFEGVSGKDKLILDVLGLLDIDTLVHGDSSDNLLANEVTDLNLEETRFAVLGNTNVDWEMCIDVTHLVLEPLGDTGDHVLDNRLDGS